MKIKGVKQESGLVKVCGCYNEGRPFPYVSVNGEFSVLVNRENLETTKVKHHDYVVITFDPMSPIKWAMSLDIADVDFPEIEVKMFWRESRPQRKAGYGWRP